MKADRRERANVEAMETPIAVEKLTPRGDGSYDLQVPRGWRLNSRVVIVEPTPPDARR
jgi:hypothetical protein